MTSVCLFNWRCACVIFHCFFVFQGELNECFDSMAEAGRRIGSTSTNVKQCCDGVYHAIKGYHFCYANEINTYVFKQNKTNKKLIFCDKENKVYAGIKDVAKLFGVHECTIMEYCNSSNHFCKKTNCSWYYLYDQTRKDGTIIPGAITLGLITEEEALNMFEEKEND